MSFNLRFINKDHTMKYFCFILVTAPLLGACTLNEYDYQTRESQWAPQAQVNTPHRYPEYSHERRRAPQSHQDHGHNARPVVPHTRHDHGHESTTNNLHGHDDDQTIVVPVPSTREKNDLDQREHRHVSE